MKPNSKTPFLQRKGGVIHLHHVRHARTMGQRFMGLMGKSPASYNYALIFHPTQPGILNASIHMMFMRMPIDVVWLDEKMKIVDRVERLPPWTLNYSPRAPAKFIIELPAGTIQKFGIKAGEKITWK